MNPLYDKYIISAIKKLPKTQADFLQLKKKLSKQYALPIPTNADLRDRYNLLLKNGKIKRSKKFEKLLLSRAIRTQSGVAVIAVLTKSYPCPGKCIYCPSEKNMPKSYLSNEPAVMRAIDAKFDPYRQVQNRLRSLELNGHATDKIELIVMGGTFSFLPKNYQKKFITECFRAANDYPQKRKVSKIKLEHEQKKNEKAKHRIIGLTLETRPDYINEKEIENFRNLGCTRVELGVQSIFNDVLKLNKRGHEIEASIEASKLLKDAGFKINYHMMPGLPGSTISKDFKMFKELFSNSKFQPDMLKIYPTVVLKNSQLYRMWKNGLYKPLSDEQFERLILKIKNEIIPPYVRISRLVRDVPTSSIIAGPIVSNLRQMIIPKSKCQCIRCREVRAGYNIKERIVLDRIDYDASDGKEIFLQYVSPDRPARGRGTRPGKKLFALLRLRIPSFICHPELVSGSQEMLKKNIDPETSSGRHGYMSVQNNNLRKLLPVLYNSAIIREVHTYGKMAKINSKDKKSLPASLREALQTGPQHIGLGKKLIKEAEKIAKKEFGLSKISVISGVGVRNYYRKLGYRLENTYMVKYIA
jgi:elongator complex protein 3